MFLKFLWKLQPMMNGGGQGIGVLQMTKWGSGTSSTIKQGKGKQRGHPQGENTSNACSVEGNNFILKTSGCIKATGRKALGLQYQVVPYSSRSIADMFKGLAFSQWNSSSWWWWWGRFTVDRTMHHTVSTSQSRYILWNCHPRCRSIFLLQFSHASVISPPHKRL